MKIYKKMLRTSLRLVALLCLFQASFTPVHASHISGVDIDYQCVGVDSFLVTVNLYRDCDGIAAPTTIDVELKNNCGTPTSTVTLNQTAFSGIEISQLCPADLPNSTCSGGPLPGMQQYEYTRIVVLQPNCNNWTISWSNCCRNASIVNIQNPGGAAMYGEVDIYTATDPCDNSPVFTASPIPYVCVGQPVFFNYGAVDPDGDSLVYSLIPARTGPLQLVQYAPGFTPPQPIPGLTLDPLTGAINFTPTMIGQFVIAVRVTEYDQNGNIKGTVMRDMQFAVINCPSNSAPVPSSALNVTGNVTQLGPTSFLICPGETLDFDLQFTDANAQDTVQLTSNVGSVLPGATFTQAGINPVTASFSWTAVPLPGISSASFIITGEDNGCPTPGLNIATVFIVVADSVTAVADQAICPGDSAMLNAVGAFSYTWSALAGPPLVVGQNVSCINCASPQVYPTTTTTYMVTGNVGGTCLNTDTVTVFVSPFFDFSNVVITNSTCDGTDDGVFDASVGGTGGPPWFWQAFQGPTLILDSTSASTQMVLNDLSPGTYTMTIGDTLGCVRDTTITLTEPDPLIVDVSNDTTICLSTSATITAIAQGGNGTYTYNWTPILNGPGPHNLNPTSNTQYNLQVEDQLGCTSNLDSVLISVLPPLNVSYQYSDSVCPGDSVSIVANVNGGIGPPYAIVWTQPGAGQVGLSGTFTYTPSSSQTTTIVSISDSCGTPAVVDTLQVTWFELPQPIFSVDTDTVCVPDFVFFENLTDSALVGNNCIWDFGDGTVVNNSCEAIFHEYTSVGCYDVNLTVESPQGCSNDTTFAQFVCGFPYPIADFEFMPEDVTVENPLVSFNSTSILADTLHWTFGWGGAQGTSTDSMPFVLFPDNRAENYPVVLWVRTEIGCADSITRVVYVDAPYEVWIPNAFTPDGDGKNEVFKMEGIGISPWEFSMQIYNRWGELVFESVDPEIGWDGSGAIPGVYTYRFEVNDLYSPDKKSYLGHVSLIR